MTKIKKMTTKRHMQKDHKRKPNDHRRAENNHKEMQNYKKETQTISNKGKQKIISQKLFCVILVWVSDSCVGWVGGLCMSQGPFVP